MNTERRIEWLFHYWNELHLLAVLSSSNFEIQYD